MRIHVVTVPDVRAAVSRVLSEARRGRRVAHASWPARTGRRPGGGDAAFRAGRTVAFAPTPADTFASSGRSGTAADPLPVRADPPGPEADPFPSGSDAVDSGLATGRPEGTVKRQLHAAVHRLRGALTHANVTAGGRV